MAASRDGTERLSQVIGAIYDATFDPGLWQEVVVDIADFVPGAFVNLFWQDATRSAAQAFFTHGIEERFLRLYLETYIHINPMFPATLFFEEEQIVTQGEVVPEDEFKRTRFYKEWIEPQGLVDSMVTVLEKTATAVTGLAVGRAGRHGRVDDESRYRLSMLVPHVRRAVTIGRIVEHHKVEAASFADTLDGLSSALFLVDADGRIRHANASGEAMLRAGTVVHTASAKLTAADPHGDGSLREAIGAAALGDGAMKRAGASLALAGRNGETYAAHVLPLMGGARRQAGANYSAVAAVFVRKAELALPHPVEALAKHYKLTAAEMRVLLATVEGGGVGEVSRTLGISEATVKTHLQRLFGKTGVTRQAELVKLVAGFMSPLGG
jgi:DNA-binding CsgD family transcriptional regulator/PAS domain-containing protein